MATFIFDFDDTLFDTKKLRDEISNKIASQGVDYKTIEDTYKETKKNLGNYNLHYHIEILKLNSTFFSHESFYNWFNQIDISLYVFPEAVELLEKISKDHYLVLLTKGEFDFQNIKIQNSNLLKYFNEFHIVPDHKELFLKDKNFTLPIYFINDKETENKKILESFPHFNINDNFRKLKI